MECQPPFTVDVAKPRFMPIIQHINELEAKTRVKLNFIDEIAKFWKLQGSSLNIPMVERKPLDLYSLHRIVQEEGGLEQTINNRKWLKIASRMGYPEEESVGTTLKNHYERILYPFDVYTSGQIHASDVKLKVQENDEHNYSPHCIESRQQVSPSQETILRRSKSLSQNNKFVPIEIKSEFHIHPYFHTLENVVNREKNLPYELVELKKMEEHLRSALDWKDRISRIFLHKKSQFTLIEVLLPRIESVMLNDFCKKFTEEMTPVQMVVAFKEAEEKEIRGMVELRKTNNSKNPETDLYCICKQKFSGIMYHCQLCNNWFHAQCVTPPENIVSRRLFNSTTPNLGIKIPMSNRDINIELKYLCQSCLRSRRPFLETIQLLLVSVKRLPIRIPEVEALQCLIERAINWQDRVRQLLTSEEITKAIEIFLELNNNIINSTQSTNIIQPPTIATSTLINNKRQSSLTSWIKDSGTPTENSSNENDFKPHHQSQQQSLQQQRQCQLQQLSQQEPSDQSTPLPLSSPLPLPLPPNSSNICIFASSTENGAPSPTNIEDVYSVLSLTSISGESTQPDGKFDEIENSKPPLIAISSAVVNNLEVLMMEGDLLEVSLDETNLIWRLLNATKYGDLSYIYHKYNINSITPIQPGYQQCTIKKRKSNYYLKQQAKLTKFSDIVVIPAISSTVNATLQNIQNGLSNSPPTLSQSPTSTNSNQSTETIVPISISQSPIIISSSESCIESKASTKRGRKLKLRQPFAISAQKNNMKRKLNKNRKKKVKLASHTTHLSSGDILNNVDHLNSLEDDDDDCSAVSCVRPPGREVDWIQCDGICDKWFHMLCVGLNKNQIKPDDDFICHKCENKKPPLHKNRIQTNCNTNNITSDDITPITNNVSSLPPILAVSRTRDIGDEDNKTTNIIVTASSPSSLSPLITANATPSEMAVLLDSRIRLNKIYNF